MSIRLAPYDREVEVSKRASVFSLRSRATGDTSGKSVAGGAGQSGALLYNQWVMGNGFVSHGNCTWRPGCFKSIQRLGKMKTYVAEIAGEAILAFRAEDDAAARSIVCEERGGLQLVVRGYSGLLRPDGRPLWDGASPIRYRLASSREHEQWLILRHSRTGGADDPDDWVVYLVPVVSVDEGIEEDGA
jgi:hypothetical protein